MTKLLPHGPMGRPRGFTAEAALQAALEVFWRQGYKATSLDELTAAMGLSRSSFYGAFGSKHAVLVLAVQSYVDRVFAALQGIAASEPDAVKAVRAMIGTIAEPYGSSKGCLFVNAVAELAPDDLELIGLARRHIDRVVSLMGSLLVQAGFDPATTHDLAGALMACAFGATMMRKAGLPGGGVASLVAQVDKLLSPIS